MDFDDLLLFGEKILREHDDVRDMFRQRFTRVTVDEFQDTNALQMQLLQQLVGPPYHVCVVGDDDQSIYGWRGAEIANILEFERFFPNPKIIRLEENYRSTHAVLHTANSLIKHNRGRREKILRSTRKGGDPVRIVAMPGDDEEAEFIAEEILAGKSAVGRKWEDFAVLFRTNGQSRKLELALRERKIPYRMVGAQSFYDRREVRDVLAYAQLLASPDADVPLLRILNAPNRGIGQSTAVLATDWSREHHESVWQALCDPNFTDTIGPKARHAIESFVALIAGAKNRIDLNQENPADVLHGLIKEIEYLQWIERGCKTDSERQQRGEGIQMVIDSLRAHAAKGKKLQSFLDDSALASDREDDDLEKKQGATLITLHASKGLEFPIVFLVGLEEGFLPHTRSIAEGTKDEERRLLYVGITRAQDNLTMTYCSKRIKWGQETGCQPSSLHRRTRRRASRTHELRRHPRRRSQQRRTRQLLRQPQGHAGWDLNHCLAVRRIAPIAPARRQSRIASQAKPLCARLSLRSMAIGRSPSTCTLRPKLEHGAAFGQRDVERGGRGFGGELLGDDAVGDLLERGVFIGGVAFEETIELFRIVVIGAVEHRIHFGGAFELRVFRLLGCGQSGCRARASGGGC